MNKMASRLDVEIPVAEERLVDKQIIPKYSNGETAEDTFLFGTNISVMK